MGLRRWVKRLERDADGLHDTLILPDGSRVRYTKEEMLEALAALCAPPRALATTPHPQDGRLSGDGGFGKAPAGKPERKRRWVLGTG
jgi:hypothetical protein